MNFQKFMEYRNNSNAFFKNVGGRITDVGEGWAKGELTLTDMHINSIGSAHGGVAFTLSDTIGGTAAGSRGKKATTVSAEIHYLSPAIHCKKLIGEAREVKYGKHMAVYEILIRDETGRSITSAVFSYYFIGDLEGFDD